MSHTDVDPPPQLRIPDVFFKEPEIRAYFEQQRTILFQLWNRTGGANDDVFRQQIRELYPRQIIQDITDLLSISVISSDYTTSGSEIVIAASNITVSLNSGPADSEEVHIIRQTTAGTVIVSGNGLNIVGNSTYQMLANYESIHCRYSSEQSEWFIT